MLMDNLRTFLPVYYVYLLDITFFLLILAFILNFKYIKAVFAEIERKTLIFLISIAVVGVFITSFIAPRIHRIFYDEDIYNNIGQCIAQQRRAVVCNEGYYENGELTIAAGEYNKQPQGYPYLISVVFRIFGTNELFTFILNNLIYGLMTFVIFLIVYLLLNDAFAGLAASLSYMLIPINLHWFNTCAAEPSTAFFSSLAILTALIYLKNKRPVNLFLLTTAMAFSFNFRPESFLIVIVIGMLFLLKDIGILKRKELYIFGVLLILLSSGIVLHTYLMKDQDWGASGPKFSLGYFPHNFSTNLIFYFSNQAFPLLFTILGAIGLLFYKYKDCIKEKIVLLSWLIVFWGIFLFFYAGSSSFGQDLRFSILSYAPISIFVGMGVSSIRNLLIGKVKSIGLILILLITFNFTWFLPFVRAQGREAWEARTGHKYAVEFAELMPENSIIFTHTPNVFLLNKKSALQSSVATYNPGMVKSLLERFKGGVFVDFNYWSNVPDPQQNRYTKNILNSYDHELIKEYHREHYRYALYEITGLKD
jgi:MFS family permease